MRSILENVAAFDFVIKRGARLGTVMQTLASTYNFAPDQPPIAWFDCGAAGRTVVLPSILNGTAMEGRIHLIVNVGVANNITLNSHADDGSAAVATIPPGGSALCFASVGKDAWYAIVEGGTSSALLGTATKVTQIIPLQLADITGTVAFALASPFAFTLSGIGFRTGKPASTASKLATLTGQVNGVSVTGGVMNLTTANQNATGTLLAGSAITAGNVGTASQTWGAVASAVTAFVEGDGWIEATLINNDLLNVLQ